MHNTQPWRWHIDGDGDNGDDGRVELYADFNRHLPATDPQRRDLLISCGAALHHLVVALAHVGLRATVLRLPDPEDPAHLATVTIDSTIDETVSRYAGLFPAIHRRHTDRRRFATGRSPPR